MSNYWSNFLIALAAVRSNKLRSLLTGLGIIFGVAAVISMMAIGTGAQEEILEQIKLVGVNNIVIEPIIEQKEGDVSDEENTQKDEKNFSPGLTLYDVKSIVSIVPGIEKISPEIIIETNLIKGGKKRSAKLVGVDNDYFSISNFELSEGSYFSESHQELGAAVCIIGKGVQSKFFSQEDPIGKRIKVGKHWLQVIGVLSERFISQKSISNLGIRDYNMDVYAPLNTVLIRYKNRSLVTEALLKRFQQKDPDEREENPNYHQLDRVVIKVGQTEQLNGVAEVVSKILKRRHFDRVDFEITIPELLLKQQQRTKSIFNFVLGAIAGISLLVGGIGIMNIMLASVMERIKEIGLRLSVGAKRRDIIFQFLSEAVMISVSGGLIGVLLGVVLAYAIAAAADINTIIKFYSILIAFGVAAAVGIIFGLTPAKRAAEQDPIESLRYE